jgi:hypothetical protein
MVFMGRPDKPGDDEICWPIATLARRDSSEPNML